MRIIVADRVIAEIPVLDVYDMDSRQKRPMILLLHGFGGCKENNLPAAYRLAKEGFHAVSLDAIRHGELRDEAFGKSSRVEKEREFWNIVTATAEVINGLIAGYQYSDTADWQQVGLLGLSMGGIIVYQYLTGDRRPNVKTAVSIVATPDWISLENGYYQNNRDAGQYINEAQQEIKRLQPRSRLDRVIDFPLLMLNGVKDEKMPIAEVRSCFLEMRERYIDKTLIQLIEYEETGHQVTNQMFDESSGWFRKYL